MFNIVTDKTEISCVIHQTEEGKEKNKKAVGWIKEHINKEIEDHEKTFCADNIRDFIDLFIQEKQEESENSLFTCAYSFNTFFSFINILCRLNESCILTRIVEVTVYGFTFNIV